MLSVGEAIEALISSARAVTTREQLDLNDALGRVTAEPIVAAIDVPPADNSAMDGYTFRHGDLAEGSTELPLSGRIAAGSAPGKLEPGTAMRIFTGAEIPEGADTVVMQEHCQALEGAVHIDPIPRPGANIRPRGQDMATGQEVLAAGSRLGPQELGLLASLGLARVSVLRRLRVAVLSNGDELREPGEPLRRGQIYNSNRPMLLALLRAWNFEPVDLGIVGDDPKAIADRLREASENADVIISSGGVSVGEEDHIKSVVESLGELSLWKIAMKPGKPLAFGRVGSTPFIGLPGNPASALVTALVIGRPFLMACQGLETAEVHPSVVAANFSANAGPRQVYHRVKQGGEGLELFPNQSSGVLLSSCWASGLAIQAPGQDIAPGDSMPYLAFSDLL